MAGRAGRRNAQRRNVVIRSSVDDFEEIDPQLKHIFKANTNPFTVVLVSVSIPSSTSWNDIHPNESVPSLKKVWRTCAEFRWTDTLKMQHYWPNHWKSEAGKRVMLAQKVKKDVKRLRRLRSMAEGSEKTWESFATKSAFYSAGDTLMKTHSFWRVHTH